MQLSAGALSRLVVASGNAGKLREFDALLRPLGFDLVAQSALGVTEAEEPFETFVENALAKARHAARSTGLPALADDSGLSVDALGGAPGVHSARYADSDSSRIARLLQELERAQATAGTPNRQAHFAAALALADPSGRIQLEVEGRCPGLILEAPRGTGGFGYDPVFLVPDVGLTFAEMDGALKGQIGHRGRAFAQLAPALLQLLDR